MNLIPGFRLRERTEGYSLSYCRKRYYKTVNNNFAVVLFLDPPIPCTGTYRFSIRGLSYILGTSTPQNTAIGFGIDPIVTDGSPFWYSTRELGLYWSNSDIFIKGVSQGFGSYQPTWVVGNVETITVDMDYNQFWFEIAGIRSREKFSFYVNSEDRGKLHFFVHSHLSGADVEIYDD